MESYYLNVINGTKKGILPSLLKAILFPISLIYALIMRIRNILYDRRWLRRHTPSVPIVISVGNITLGGSGKTPAVQMIAEQFYHEWPLAILTRGYRSAAENAPQPLVLHGAAAQNRNGTEVGDEALLHAHRFPDAYVIVNKNRIESSNIASKKGVKVIILDDGMQHRKLNRHYEVAIVNCQDSYEEAYVFPRGPLRESPRALARADMVIINNAEDTNVYQAARQQIGKYTKATCIGTRLKVTAIYDLQRNTMDSLKGRTVALFCAIGNPESFTKTIKSMGCEVIDSITASDHKAFSTKTLKQYADNCAAKGIDCLVCTEKDKVKIDPNTKFALPIYWVEVKMEVVQDNGHWNSFINNLTVH